MNEKYGSSGRVSHSIKIALGFALAGAVAFPAATQAATNAQKQAAIDSGLAWLVTQQQTNGNWIYNGGSGDVAATGAALLRPKHGAITAFTKRIDCMPWPCMVKPTSVR